MVAYHTQRWQQELEREQQGATKNRGEQGAVDVADAPTMLIRPSDAATPQISAEVTTPAAQAREDDIALQPTIVMSPLPNEGKSTPPADQEPSLPAAAPTLASSPGVTTPDEASDTAHAANGSDSNIRAAEVSSAETTASTPSEEDTMEQAPEPTEDRTGQDLAVGAFPTLEVGKTVCTRYEVTQVISADENEHVYQVTDHQGYQHCWNCGSEENAEGDEFCIDCGAELSHATYTMHEYPASESADNESHVLPGDIVNTLVEQGYT